MQSGVSEGRVAQAESEWIKRRALEVHVRAALANVVVRLGGYVSQGLVPGH